MSASDQLDFKQRNRIVTALLACRCLSTPKSRDQVLDDLPVIKHRANRFENAWQDVLSIVNTCLDYPEGLKALLEIVEVHEGNSLFWQNLQRVLAGLSLSSPERQRLHLRCNRSEQREKFEEAFGQAQARPPFLCLIHGDEFACHGDFVKRLHTEILPGLLSGSITPWTWTIRNPLAPVDQYWTELARTQLNHRFTLEKESRKSLYQEIDCLGTHVLIHWQWLSENFAAVEKDGLANFVKFWESWPQFPENRQVICALTLKYQKSKESRDWRALWRPSLNERIRGWVGELEKQSNPQLKVLPPLDAVPRKEAEAWSNDPEVLRVRDITDAVGALYHARKDAPMSMKELTDALKKLLADPDQAVQPAGHSFERK